MAGAAVDRPRKARKASRSVDDASPDLNYVPYTGPIAPPPPHRGLKLLPDDPATTSPQPKSVAYDDGLTGWEQPSSTAGLSTTSAFEYGPPAFLASALGGGIGESPVHVRAANNRRDGSSSSQSESTAAAGKGSFSRAAKEFFPFIGAVLPDRPTHRSPGLSSVSTPTSDSFSTSASEFDLPPAIHTRQRSSSTSVLSEQQPSNGTSSAASILPLVRSRSSRRSSAPRKISEPFLTPAEPVQAFVPSRPAPDPSASALRPPEVALLSPPGHSSSGGRALSPYLRNKLSASASVPNLARTSPSPVRRQQRPKRTMYEASTFCDTLVYPQPKLKPFLISPPATPRSDSSSTFSAGPDPERGLPSSAGGGILAACNGADTAASDRDSFEGPARPTLSLEERVRREGETREHERASWARATRQASLSRSFDHKRQRRRSKSLGQLQAGGAHSAAPAGKGASSPPVPTSFDFLRNEPRTPTKASAPPGDQSSRSPLRSAMKAMRRSSSLGHLRGARRDDDLPPKLPRVQIGEAIQLPRSGSFVGQTLASSNQARRPPSAAGSVVDIGYDEGERTVWKAAPRIAVEDLASLPDTDGDREIGVALSPVTDQHATRPSSRDRHRHPSRAGSVSSIQAFHRRFPSTASSSGLSRPLPTAHRQSWKGHGATQSLDSAGPSEEPLSHSLRARKRLSRSPSDHGDEQPLASAPARMPTFTLSQPADKYTAIPVVRPLSKSSSSRSSLDRSKGLQQAWAFPTTERRGSSGSPSGVSSPSSPASARRRGSSQLGRRDSVQTSETGGTPVPLFVYGDDYENLFYRPESSAPDTVVSPPRSAFLSSASLASSAETYSASDSPDDDDDAADATIMRISHFQVPALRSPESVHRHAYFPSPHRQSLVPEEVGSASPSFGPDSPDSRGSVVHQFPQPPFAGAADARSVSFSSQTQDSHYVTADDGSHHGGTTSYASASEDGDDVY